MRKPQEIPLAEAAGHIRHTAARHHWPFFFMVGAGVSCPPVPLAGAIVEDCKKESGIAEAPAGLTDPMKTYSWWFQHAFHSPSDRQWYLRRLIENKFVSHANLRLAHLLLSRKITNLVVTTNFDEFLSQSLSLFGEAHIVCDHPETIQRIDVERDDLQIVHVHGTYWFYDCCNLEGEIEARSRKPPQSAASMGDFLDRILANRSPLVLGYSGWPGDVFMSALKRRLRHGLPYNIYWFVYQRSSVQAFPEELRTHPNVFFVVSGASSKAAESPRARAAHVIAETAAPLAGEPVLPASEVLDALVTEFQLDAPPLTRDPLGFFADQLRRSLPQDAVTHAGRDIYLIGRVIRRIDQARHALTAADAQLEKVRDALRRSAYEEAIRSALDIPRQDLDIEQARELIEALLLASSKLTGHFVEENAAYQRVIQWGGELLQQLPDDVALRESIAKALVNFGNVAGELKLYDEVITRFGSETEPTLRYQVARAMYNKGPTYDQMKQPEKALEAYRVLVDRFHDTNEPRIRDLLGWATLETGVSLAALGKLEEADLKYREVIERFGAIDSPDCREVCSAALNALGDNRIREAKAAWLTGGKPAAAQLLNEARTYYGQALQRSPNDPYILASHAYLQFLQGDPDQARGPLARAIAAGGDDLRSSLAEFIAEHPLPLDAEFKALLDSIPPAPSLAGAAQA